MRLARVSWSPQFSQRLCGYDDKNRFQHTPRVFMTEDPNVYVTSIGEKVEIVSWAVDVRQYRDKR